jgi:hypothetical protein
MTHLPHLTSRLEAFDAERHLQSARWAALEPIYPTSTDLSPSSLTAETLAIITDTVVTAANEHLTVIASPERYALVTAVPDTHAMTKRCFDVETDDGRVMAQIVPGRSIEGGQLAETSFTIPAKPHFTMVNAGDSQRLWEYSDPATYVQVPLTEGYLLQLQEHAGVEYARGGPVGWWERRQAAKRAFDAIHQEFVIDPQDERAIADEAARDKNHLSKPGIDGSLTISIRFTERNVPGQELPWRVP